MESMNNQDRWKDRIVTNLDILAALVFAGDIVWAESFVKVDGIGEVIVLMNVEIVQGCNFSKKSAITLLLFSSKLREYCLMGQLSALKAILHSNN